MSRLSFQSTNDVADLRGWEYTRCGGVVTDFALAALGGLDGSFIKEDPIWRVIVDRPSYYENSRSAYHLSLIFSMMGADDPTRLSIDGYKIRPWDAALNTCIAVGRGPLQLMARLAAQGEIFAWVDGPNRKWLADIIREGRSSGLYRPNSGWEDVVEMLERDDQEPVVTSYSSSDSFPNPTIAEEVGTWSSGIPLDVEDRRDAVYSAWELLNHDHQWEYSMEALRGSFFPLEMEPAGWDDIWFGTGESKRYTVMDARRAAQEIEERLPGTAYGRIYTLHEVKARV